MCRQRQLDFLSHVSVPHFFTCLLFMASRPHTVLHKNQAGMGVCAWTPVLGNGGGTGRSGVQGHSFLLEMRSDYVVGPGLSLLCDLVYKPCNMYIPHFCVCTPSIVVCECLCQFVNGVRRQIRCWALPSA